ncbi:MAG: hypothetical protein P8L71_13880 [Flavobacteriales bacterium]|nr:hypothetical protein [Flavobacteriales bacterium]
MHYLKWGVSLLLIGISSICAAQMIQVDEGEIDFRQLSFEPLFIVRNNIKTITADEREMRYGQTIKELGSFITYHFDTTGHCTSRITSRTRYGRLDSIVERFKLEGDKLRESIRQDQRSYLRQEMTTSGDTTSFCRYRGNNEGIETWLSCEYHVVSRTDETHTVEIMNDQKRPYHTKRYYYDSLNYLIRIEETFLVTRKQQTVSFTYTDDGQLAERLDKSAKGESKCEYRYGQDGLLESIYYYEGGEIVWEREIVIGASGRLDALLKRDPDTGDIRIDKYSYEFHD